MAHAPPQAAPLLIIVCMYMYLSILTHKHNTTQGVGVGNGLTDPEIQYRYYGQMAYNNSYGIKAVDEATFEEMEEALPKCIALIHRCQRDRADFACNMAQSYCDENILSKYVESGM